MTPAWYLHRLAAMSGRELLFRLREAVRRAIARRRRPTYAEFTAGSPPRPLPGVVLGASPAQRAAVRAAADRLLAGGMTLLGITWPRCDPASVLAPDAWWIDPITGSRWPGSERFCFDIDYRHAPGRGDVKYVWELNRLQILQPLAAAHALFEDRAALHLIEQLMLSWRAGNPPSRGLGWASGIEVALRAISVLVVLSLCGPALAPDVQAELGPLLRAHRDWLGRFPARYSSANNHRVAELVGLFLIDTSLGAPESAIANHLAALAHEAERQILPDGAPAEQSPSYGAFTAELLALATLVARADGRRIPPAITMRLRDFALFCAALGEADGRLPHIGDDDEGRVLTLGGPEPAYPASVTRLVARILAAPCALGTPDPAALREMIGADQGAPDPAPAPAPDALVHFEHGGLTAVRWHVGRHRLRLIVDHGPLGYLALAAHGHADANAILLSVDGCPVFVDPGTFLYHAGGPWRDWFRGTRAHNTLTLDGRNQSTITGPFNWGRRARAHLLSARGAPDWKLRTTHDGYRRRFGADHRRTLSATPHGFAILDEAATTRIAAVELVIQLAADLDARAVGTRCSVSRGGVDLLAIDFDASGRLFLARGEARPDGGWVSERFGVRVPAWRLSWTRGDARPPIRTTVRILGEADAS